MRFISENLFKKLYRILNRFECEGFFVSWKIEFDVCEDNYYFENRHLILFVGFC